MTAKTKEITIKVPVAVLKNICAVAVEYALEDFFDDDIMSAINRKEVEDELYEQVDWTKLFQYGFQDHIDDLEIEYAKTIAWENRKKHKAIEKAFDKCDKLYAEKRKTDTYAGVN